MVMIDLQLFKNIIAEGRHNGDLLDSYSPNQFKTKERLIGHVRDLNVVNDQSEITILGGWYGSILIPAFKEAKRISLIDMDKNESDDILKKIFSHQERLDFTCRFKWTENAIAIWDNRSTLHQGLTDFFPGRGLGYERIMDRIAIEGDHPQ